MAWYFYVIIIVAVGFCIFMGIMCEKLGQWCYFRRLAKGAVVNSVLQKFVSMQNINKNVDILFIGDSITDQYSTSDYFYPNAVINRGISGDTSAGVLSRINSCVLALAPKKIVLLIGINDLSHNVSPEEIFENIKKFDTILKENLPNAKLFIQSVYPVSKQFESLHGGRKLAKNVYIDELNNLLEQYCTQNNRQYIDVASLLKTKDGYLKKEYTADGLHVVHEGYEVITAALKKYI